MLDGLKWAKRRVTNKGKGNQNSPILELDCLFHFMCTLVSCLLESKLLVESGKGLDFLSIPKKALRQIAQKEA